MKNKATTTLLILFFGLLAAYWFLELARVPTEKERLAMSGLVLPELRAYKPEDFRRIEIAGGGEAIIIERDESGHWMLREPLRAPASRARVDAFLSAMKQLKPRPESGKLSGDPEGFGLESPRREVRLFAGASEEPVATLRLGDEAVDGREQYVQSDGTIRVVDANFLKATEMPPAQWRERGLFSLATSDVVKMEIKGPDRDLLLERDPSQQWRIVAPIEAVGDMAKIDGAIAELLALRVPESSDEGFVANDVEDLRPYGLETPVLTATLTAKDGHVQSAQFGKGIPEREGFAFAKQADQNDILMVDVSKITDLGKSANSFRSQYIFSFNPARIDRIIVEDARRRVAHEVVRNRGAWAVTRPLPGPADVHTIETFLKGLRSAQATAFFRPDQASDSGIDSPSLVITLSEQSNSETPGQPIVFKVGNHDGFKKVVYGQIVGDPTLLVLPDNLLMSLPDSAEWFRDRTLLSFDPRGLGELRKAIGGQETVLKTDRTGQIWLMTEPVHAPANFDAISRITAALGSLRAERLVTFSTDEPGKYGLDQPWMTLSWTLADGGASKTLAIGKESDPRTKSRFAKLSDQEVIFTLPQITLAAFNAEWHDPQVLSFTAERATGIRLNWGEGDLSYKYAPSLSGSPAWQVAQGKAPATIGPGQIDLLVRQLASLQILRFAQYAGPFRDDYGLAKPALRIAVTYTEKDKPLTRELRLGRMSDEGLFATVAEGDSGPVFLLPASLWGGWIKAGEPEPKLPDNVFAPERD